MTSTIDPIYGTLPRGWRYLTLGQLVADGDGDLQTGPFGTMLHASAYRRDGTPVVAVQHIGDNRLRHDDLPRVDDADRDRLERYLLQDGDILFGRKGAVERRAIVTEEEDGWLQGSDCIRIRFNPAVVDPWYISYVLGAQPYREWIVRNAQGATMPSLNQEIIGRIPVPFAPLTEQRAIAVICRAFEARIHLNRRTNKTLESIARATFKSWFVDFDPVRAKAEGRQPAGMDSETAALFPSAFIDSQTGRIPTGWSSVKVDSVIGIKREGLNPGEFPDETFDHYSIPAFDEGRMPKQESGESIKSNKFIVPPQTVLLSKLNPRFPRVWLPEMNSVHRAVCSTEFIVSEPKPGVSREFVYCLFGSLVFAESFSGLVTGTSGSHQRVKPEDLLHMGVIQPPQALVARFTELVGPMLKNNSALTEQSLTLSLVRDALLPKLLSGELRIRDAEKIVEAHV